MHVAEQCARPRPAAAGAQCARRRHRKDMEDDGSIQRHSTNEHSAAGNGIDREPSERKSQRKRAFGVGVCSFHALVDGDQFPLVLPSYVGSIDQGRS
jgi:hypothetical protein